MCFWASNTVAQSTICVALFIWSGGASPEEYWKMMTELAAPIVAALSKADADTIAKVKAEVLADMAAHYPSGNIDGCGIVITAVK
jgi:hypothetical protein